MKKITLNEELSRIQEMMGVKKSLEELSPSDMVNSMREEETDENNEESAIGGWDLAMEEGNLGHNEIASLEPEGRFWVVTWRTMDGKEEKVFTDEDEARNFMYKLNKPTPEIPGFEGTTDSLDDLGIREEDESFMKMRAGKDGPVFENEEMGEGKNIKQETYFETQSAALDSAEEYAKHKGYTVNWDSINAEHVAYGQTVKYSVELLKDGKPVKKMLQISLYRMESGKYELTNYIN